MTELIEWIENGSETSVYIIRDKAKELLEKEKENIIKAYKEGWKQGANFSADPELYFTSSYLSNEEKSL